MMKYDVMSGEVISFPHPFEFEPAVIILTSEDGTVWDVSINNDGSITRAKRSNNEGGPYAIKIVLEDADGGIWDVTIENDGSITRTKRSA